MISLNNQANTLILASGHRVEKAIELTQASNLQNCEIINWCHFKPLYL